MESSAYKEIMYSPVISPAKNLAKQSKLIDASSPMIYRPAVSSTSVAREVLKVDIGSPDKSTRKPERVLMVVGATGAGKTTLINALANYVLGVKWEDEFRFKVVHDCSNQTRNITIYTFHPTIVPYVLTVIDMPGFGDTEGLTKQIQNFFSKDSHGIDQLHGIGFVTQASLVRLAPAQTYVFDAVLSILGNDLAEDADIPYKKHFKLNDSAIFTCNTSSDANFKAMFWKMATESFDEFFSSFSTAAPHSLETTREVIKERKCFGDLIPNLQMQVEVGLSRLDLIQQDKRVLQQHEEDIDANKDFTYRIKIQNHWKPRKSAFTTYCMKCSHTCHEMCKVRQNAKKDQCCSMTNGSCTVCPGKCQWQSHMNTSYVFGYCDEYEDRTFKDLKIRYESAQSDKSTTQSMIATNEDALRRLQMEVIDLIKRLKSSIERLNEIGLRPAPPSNFEYIDLRIESEKMEHTAGWQYRVEQYEKIREDAKTLPDLTEEEEGKDWWLKWHCKDANPAQRRQHGKVKCIVKVTPVVSKSWWDLWK